jgi:DNA-binding LacI/PurR family transcriptional regulator
MTAMTEGARQRRGSAAPTLADVAQRAGVSHQTVSRVLNDSPAVRDGTRMRVLEAIEELGYRRNSAARALATNRSGRIGLISAHLALYGPSTIAASIHRAGREAGYEVSLAAVETFSPKLLESAVDRLLDEAVEAVLVAVAHDEARDIVRGLELAIPVVVVQGVTAGEPMAAGVDQAEGASLATDHLVELGHRHIAHVTGPLDWVEAQQRRAGWLQALDAHGLAPGREIHGDWTPESGYQAGRELAAHDDVTAVFAANDSMALGVLKALHEQGRRVPEAVSVVGFDDVPEAAYFWPGLTTVRQDFRELGEHAVELVVRALAGEVQPSLELVTPTLVVRDSAREAQPRASASRRRTRSAGR